MAAGAEANRAEKGAVASPMAAVVDRVRVAEAVVGDIPVEEEAGRVLVAEVAVVRLEAAEHHMLPQSLGQLALRPVEEPPMLLQVADTLRR